MLILLRQPDRTLTADGTHKAVFGAAATVRGAAAASSWLWAQGERASMEATLLPAIAAR